jgi:ABC-2 type transport system permease protein
VGIAQKEDIMFIQLLKYRIINMLRTKDELFWCLAFPLILGTLFYASFGSVYEKNEVFKSIDIAYVAGESNRDEQFEKVLDSLSGEEENKIVNIVTTSDKEAVKLLADKEIAGIIYNTDHITLTVNGEGINESILNSFLNQYIQKKETIMQVIATSPDKLEQVLAIETSGIHSLKEISFTNGTMDNFITYFYALIAMSCLYGCFAGVSTAINMKANLSVLGARRIIAPTNKMKIILADFLGTVAVQFVCSMVTVFYLLFVLKIDFGQKLYYIILTVLVGSIIGIATGIFIGSIGRQSDNIKISISLAVTMIECFLSGLMAGNMKDIIEHHVPIINRINPAALIVDAFYSLNIYDTYERYTKNMLSMLVIAALLCVGSFLVIRRERYASI